MAAGLSPRDGQRPWEWRPDPGRTAVPHSTEEQVTFYSQNKARTTELARKTRSWSETLGGI